MDTYCRILVFVSMVLFSTKLNFKFPKYKAYSSLILSLFLQEFSFSILLNIILLRFPLSVVQNYL